MLKISRFNDFHNFSGEYLMVSSADGFIMSDYLDDNIVNNNYNDELTATLNLIKGINILKT